MAFCLPRLYAGVDRYVWRKCMYVYIYLGYRKIEELEISDAKIDRNISDLTLILVNILLGLVRLG